MSNLVNFLNDKEEVIPSYQLKWFTDNPSIMLGHKESAPLRLKQIEKDIKKVGYSTQNMGAAEYHNFPGISSTGIRDYINDRKLYEWRLKYKNNLKKEEKLSLHFHIGHAVHSVLTGNGKIVSEEQVRRDSRFSSFDLKAMELALDNIYMLRDKDFEMVKTWIDGCIGNSVISLMFNNPMGIYEQAIFCKCPETGLLLKFCPDVLDAREGIIVDIKTSADWQHWETTVRKYGYDKQAAFYLYCCNIALGENVVKNFSFLYLSKKIPYRISIKKILPKTMQEAMDDVILGLTHLKKSLLNDDWGSIVNENVEWA